ncbi:MAG: flagellar hook assembly protein FlgD [Betaproteobacteria bacterium]|nr:flagellar hook assembly protein FlgD [Betaproteobacteria bacterium]MBP6188275.1 flagellar hook assembly protein FlgD [Azonexus sp.]MBP6202564.1 flagellar hook assembly protein FlgD [Azonexus sp.]
MSSVTSTSTVNSVFKQLSESKTGSTSDAEQMSDRFMTLLVTQMQNQDPLNPLDNAELTSQLAQINTVKGIDSLNSTLQKLLTSYSDALSMQSSSLVGKNVLAAGNSLQLGDAGALGGVKLAGDADKVSITITDAKGVKVAQQDLGAQKAGVLDFGWDGKNSDGVRVANGSYQFSVQATQGANKVTTTALEVGTVSALVRGQSGFQLEIPGTGLVDFNSVQQIY